MKDEWDEVFLTDGRFFLATNEYNLKSLRVLLSGARSCLRTFPQGVVLTLMPLQVLRRSVLRSSRLFTTN